MTIICIDGPNGAGKSFLVDEVYRLFRYSHQIHIFRDSIIHEILKKHDIGSNYLQARKFLQKEIEALLNHSGQIILLERWLPSFLVFESRNCNDYDANYSIWRESNFLNPDLTLVVFAEIGVLKERIGRRKNFDLKMPLREQLECFESACDYLMLEKSSYIKAKDKVISFIENLSIEDYEN